MTPTREQYELAAKAAGIEIRFDLTSGSPTDKKTTQVKRLYGGALATTLLIR